jgi:hypothetical protein
MARYADRIEPERLRELVIEVATRRLLSSEDWEQEDVDDMNSRDPMGVFTHALQEEGVGKIVKDVSKIDFSMENLYVGAPREDTSWHASLRDLLGFRRIGDLSILGCLAGGDWEEPVVFVVYHDGKDLRGYVPTAGNSFVVSKKAAADASAGQQARPFDVAAMLADVADRIQVR